MRALAHTEGGGKTGADGRPQQGGGPGAVYLEPTRLTPWPSTFRTVGPHGSVCKTLGPCGARAQQSQEAPPPHVLPTVACRQRWGLSRPCYGGGSEAGRHRVTRRGRLIAAGSQPSTDVSPTVPMSAKSPRCGWAPVRRVTSRGAALPGAPDALGWGRRGQTLSHEAPALPTVCPSLSQRGGSLRGVSGSVSRPALAGR